ncbi:MAG: ABC transporter ATP-binding protein [Bacillus sp. (in: Bacteria)]|nr:ABC transporter ATP-binding protein [Bacillus sp. (in: firmicutes)]
MENILTVNNAKRKYKRFQLGPINVQIPKGMITAIIGRNGAGKTTFLKGISGLSPLDEGEIAFNGNPVDFLLPEIRTKMSYISNEVQMYSDFTVKQAIDFIASLQPNWDHVWAEEWLKAFDINPASEIHELSKGMKMKLTLLLGLGHQPELVLLDEPTDGLDSIARQQFLDLMQKYMENEEKSIVLSTHYTQEVEGICDYVMFIKNGKMQLVGEVAELKERYRYFSLPPNVDLSDIDGIPAFEKTDLETKGVILTEKAAFLPTEAIIKIPSLDHIFFYVVEQGGREGK